MAKYLFVMANEGARWGGSELLWSAAAEKLARSGNEVRVSAKDWGERVPQVEKLRAVGCKISYIDYRIPPLFSRQIRRFRGTYSVPAYQGAHFRRAAEGVDLVVISQGSNDDGLPWMEFAYDLSHRYVLVAQSAVPFMWPPDNVAERLARGYDRAARCYFVSQAILDLSRRQSGSSLSNAKVVRNPFNVRYDANPPWPEGTADELCLALVARLDIISKGHDLVLEVLSQSHWRERKVRISFIGAGPHERGLRRMAAAWNLTSVTFAGHLNDIEEIWTRHHALLLPSRFEGMPLTLVEAMLCGRAAIVTDVGGNRELIRDGVNGFVAKAATSELLDEAMNRAWNERHRLQQMGCAAARDVRHLVSRDPAKDFANELARVASGAG